MRVVVLSETAQKFDGVEYFIAGRYWKRGKTYLHRAVWVYHHGPIPDGHHIHHKDGNRSNNQVENLEPQDGMKHLAKHKLEWNRTAEAKRMHKELGLRNVHHTHENVRTFLCVVCGNPYQAMDCGTNKYCSPLCTSRRYGPNKPAYKKERTCVWCGRSFMTRHKSPTCSISCGQARSWAKKADR